MFGAPTKTYGISSVHEKEGKLYFASVSQPTIAIIDRNIRKDRIEEEAKTGEEL